MNSQDRERLKQVLSLTSDPEVQSEMWIIMATDPSSHPEAALENAMRMLRESENAFWVMSSLISNRLKPHTIDLIEALEPVEKSVVSMIMLGFSRSYILEYNSLSCIRYNQVMKSIVLSGAWRKFVEEEANFRATSGS